MFFLSLSLGGKIETKIFTNLYHVVTGKTTSNPWKIYITDILGSNRRRQTCNFLQILYDPDNKVADQILDKGSLHTERLCAARRPSAMAAPPPHPPRAGHTCAHREVSACGATPHADP